MATGRGLLVLLAAALVAACGGGGGGGSTAVPASPAVIDSTNAPLIASQVMTVGFGATDFGTALSGSGLLAVNGGSDTLAQDLNRRQALAAGGTASPSATIAPETYGCLVSGTVRLSGTLASEETLTAGDVLNATFTDCDDGDGAVYDGSLRVEVTDFYGDLYTSQYFLDAGLTLTSFRITDADGSTSANGDMDLELDLTVSDQPVVAASGQRLTVSDDGGSWELRDYALIVTVDPDTNGGLTYQSAAGTLEGPDFEGSVEFLTVVPFALGGDGLPLVGEALITGADGATIRVTADGTGGLLLAVDLDGDGQVDETQELAWES